MNSGYMRLMALKSLSEEPMTGYGLMKTIGEFTGKRPSAGSMYPMLDELLNGGLISAKKKGKGSLFSLTAKGRKYLDGIMEEKRQLMIRNIELLKKTECIGCDNDSVEIDALLKLVHDKSNTFMKHHGCFEGLGKAMTRLMLSKDIEKKEAKAMRIIADATKKLEALAGEK